MLFTLQVLLMVVVRSKTMTVIERIRIIFRKILRNKNVVGISRAYENFVSTSLVPLCPSWNILDLSVRNLGVRL